MTLEKDARRSWLKSAGQVARERHRLGSQVICDLLRPRAHPPKGGETSYLTQLGDILTYVAWST